MLANGTDIGIQMMIADQSRSLLDRALPFVTGRIKFVQELVERDPDIASCAMLLDRFS